MVKWKYPNNYYESNNDETYEENNLDNYLLNKDREMREIRCPARYLDANLVIYALNVSVFETFNERKL